MPKLGSTYYGRFGEHNRYCIARLAATGVDPATEKRFYILAAPGSVTDPRSRTARADDRVAHSEGELIVTLYSLFNLNLRQAPTPGIEVWAWPNNELPSMEDIAKMLTDAGALPPGIAVESLETVPAPAPTTHAASPRLEEFLEEPAARPQTPDSQAGTPAGAARAQTPESQAGTQAGAAPSPTELMLARFGETLQQLDSRMNHLASQQGAAAPPAAGLETTLAHFGKTLQQLDSRVTQLASQQGAQAPHGVESRAAPVSRDDEILAAASRRLAQISMSSSTRLPSRPAVDARGRLDGQGQRAPGVVETFDMSSPGVGFGLTDLPPDTGASQQSELLRQIVREEMRAMRRPDDDHIGGDEGDGYTGGRNSGRAIEQYYQAREHAQMHGAARWRQMVGRLNTQVPEAGSVSSRLMMYFATRSDLRRHRALCEMFGLLIEVVRGKEEQDSEKEMNALASAFQWLDQAQWDDGKVAFARLTALLPELPVQHEPNAPKRRPKATKFTNPGAPLLPSTALGLTEGYGRAVKGLNDFKEGFDA